MTNHDVPHRRRNPLTGEWILVSPQRLQRPWQGRVEQPIPDDRPAHDPQCYLCPGNTRANGERNPDYHNTFVFTNDFPAILPATADFEPTTGLFTAEPIRGECRVLCFSPRHDLTLSRMNAPHIRAVVDAWADECTRFAAQPHIDYVQVFENKGTLMGCSNPHPHGQIWATSTVPLEVRREDTTQRAHFQQYERTLLADYLAEEQHRDERIVCDNDEWTAIVPWWAKWPFETIVIPARPVARIPELDADARDALADILRRLTIRYDNLFACPFPYTMGFHQAPLHDNDPRHWHLHAHFYPPLLRSAHVQKFMVGYEMLATPQRDITPEHAATRLREQPEVHYQDAQP